MNAFSIFFQVFMKVGENFLQVSYSCILILWLYETDVVKSGIVCPYLFFSKLNFWSTET